MYIEDWSLFNFVDERVVAQPLPNDAVSHNSALVANVNATELYEMAFTLANKAKAAESKAAHAEDFEAAAFFYHAAGEILVKAALRDLDVAARSKGYEFLARAKLLRVSGERYRVKVERPLRNKKTRRIFVAM
jgi:hypothetical protein